MSALECTRLPQEELSHDRITFSKGVAAPRCGGFPSSRMYCTSPCSAPSASSATEGPCRPRNGRLVRGSLAGGSHGHRRGCCLRGRHVRVLQRQPSTAPLGTGTDLTLIDLLCSVRVFPFVLVRVRCLLRLESDWRPSSSFKQWASASCN